MVDLELSNCRTEPWSSYLRGLAVLRLVAKQNNPSARGSFREGRFVLSSTLDRDGLLDYFVKEYQPTPVVSPWNGGSGFYPKDDVRGIDLILSSTDPRFDRYRNVIAIVRSWPELPNSERSLEDILELAIGQLRSGIGPVYKDLYDGYVHDPRSLGELVRTKGLPKNKFPYEDIFSVLRSKKELIQKGEWDIIKGLSVEDAAKVKNADNRTLMARVKKIRTFLDAEVRKGIKELLQRKCRASLPIESLEWIDAAMIVDGEGEASYPPLLGGGNEGNLEYSRTFISNVGGMLLSSTESESRELIANSLFGERTNKMRISPMGMFDPGRAGGYNQGVGIESKDFPANPWDFIFAIEGSMLWASSITRREGDRHGSLSSPFTARSKSVGYASSSEEDSLSGTFELWAPIWGMPATYNEIKYLMAEGRAYVGRSSPYNGVQFAIALATLGVDRGIEGFTRFGIFKRRGDNKVVMPLGLFKVRQIPHAELLKNLDDTLHLVDNFLGRFKGKPPAPLVSARRNIDLAILDVVSYGSPSSFKSLLGAIGRLERLLAQRDLDKDPALYRPLGGLSIEWLLAADDGSVEIRLAGAINSLYDKKIGPWRSQMAQVDPLRPFRWAEGKGNVSWGGGNVYLNLSRSLRSRVMVSADVEGAHPLRASIYLHPADVMPLLREEIDESVLEDLLWGITWINWNLRGSSPGQLREVRNRWSRPLSWQVIPRGWTMLGATLSPRRIGTSDGNMTEIEPDNRAISLLLAGRYDEAVRVAQRKLYSHGVPVRKAGFDEPLDGVKVAASLLVPTRFTIAREMSITSQQKRS